MIFSANSALSERRRQRQMCFSNIAVNNSSGKAETRQCFVVLRRGCPDGIFYIGSAMLGRGTAGAGGR
jgi:hypothetical protein